MSEKSDGWEERGLGDLFSGDEVVVTVGNTPKPRFDLEKSLGDFTHIDSRVSDPNETSWITDLCELGVDVVEVYDDLSAGAYKISMLIDLDNLPGDDEGIEIIGDTSVADDIADVLASTHDVVDEPSSAPDIFSDDLDVILGENPGSIQTQSGKANPAKRSWLGLKISDLLNGNKK